MIISGIFVHFIKNTTTLCKIPSNIELGKEGEYISYNNRGQFGGAIYAAGQASDILVLVYAGTIRRGKLCPELPFCFGSDSPPNVILLNWGEAKLHPIHFKYVIILGAVLTKEQV